MRNGLVIGGNSGIGKQFISDAENDDRFEDVVWLAPSVQDMDVRNRSSVSLFVRDHGPFDFLVYCAGVNTLQWIGEIHQSVVDDTFAVNVEGFIWLLDAHERNHPGSSGSVVAISSDASRIAMRTSISYCSSKAALNMAVRVAARELAPRWQVNAVAPGIIADTPMTDYIDRNVPDIRGWSAERAQSYERSMIPVGRRGTKAEIAHVMRDLLQSPGYLTGTIVEISGGK
jgi:NAD(P)-dependent dehydrogenase (short-subunit alcohol dehydrogenase family)